LNGNSPPKTVGPTGTITVSVVFQPVSSVAQSASSHPRGSIAAAISPGGSDDDDSSVSSSRSKRSSNNWMQQAVRLPFGVYKRKIIKFFCSIETTFIAQRSRIE